MKHRRAWCAGISAFLITVCLLGTVGALLLTDLRSGRILFGDAYEQVTVQQETAVERGHVMELSWLPVRLQLLWRIPQWEARVMQWLLSR